jgi:hypothetical protein
MDQGVVMLNWCRLAIAMGLLAVSGRMAAAQNATIQDIRVQLFYEYTGALSDDLTKRKDLSLFNTMIGEGDAKQPANSFLVAVSVKGQPDTFDKAAALTVTVTTDDKRKSKVAEKAFGSGMLFGPEGQVVKAMMVHDRVCAPLIVTAKLKSGASKSVNLPFKCGE